MQPRTLLILSIVVIGLGAFIWLYERDLPSSEERAEFAKKVLQVESDDVERLLLEWEGNRVALERHVEEDGGEEKEAGAADSDNGEPTSPEWRITEPLEFRADRWAVDGLVGSLTDLDKERTLEGVELAGVGLNEPRARVTLVTGEKEHVLEIGAPVPASSSMLVKVAGRPEVFVVSDALYDDVTKAAGEWRSRDVFPGQRDEIERLVLAPGGDRILLARRGDEFWLESPISDRAQRDLVQSLITEVVGLRVAAFVDEPPPLAELGLEPPVGILEVVLRGRERPLRVELGSLTGEDDSRSYARTDGLLFETTASLREPLTRPVAAWQSKNWSALPVYKIDATEVGSGEAVLRLERSGTEWLRDGVRIPYSPVSDFLYALNDAEAARLLAPEEVAALGALLEHPTMTITHRASDESEEVLILYEATEEGVPVRVSDREAVLLLSPDTVEEVREKLEAVRTAEPLPEAPSEEGEESEEDPP